MLSTGLYNRISVERRKWLIALIIFGLIIGVGCSTVFRAGFDVKIRTDLSVYRLAGIAALQNTNLYEVVNERTWFYTSPPIVAMLCIPLAFVPLVWGALLVYLFSVALLFISVWFLLRILPDHLNTDEKKRALLTAFACSTIFLSDVLTRGQFGILVLFSLVLTLYFWLKKKTVRAGLCLGFAVAIKITPALLLVPFFILRGERKIFLWAILGAAIFTFLIPGFYYGFPETASYLKTWVREIPLTAYQAPASYNEFYAPDFAFWRQMHDPFTFRNQSLYAVWARMLMHTRENISLAGIFGARSVAHVFSGILLLVTLRAWSRKYKRTADHILLFGLGIIVMLVSSPLAWTHYFSVLLIPYVAWLGAFGDTPQETKKCGQIIFSSSVACMLLGYGIPLFRNLGFLLWSALILWAGILWLLDVRQKRIG